jgi:hypothetical protein
MKMWTINDFFDPERKPEMVAGAENALFYHDRLRYLDAMPPFTDNVMLYLTDKTEIIEAKEGVLQVIFKLQCILCSRILHQDIIEEIVKFLSSENEVEIVGSLSLLSIIHQQNRVTEMLLHFCPQCVLDYAKDHYANNIEWSFLIERLFDLIGKPETDSHADMRIVFYKRILKGE